MHIVLANAYPFTFLNACTCHLHMKNETIALAKEDSIPEAGNLPQKKNYFIENHKLPPMEFLNFTVFDVYEFREGNAKSKKYKRHKIMKCKMPVLSAMLWLNKTMFPVCALANTFHGICMCMRPVDHLKLIKMQRLRK